MRAEVEKCIRDTKIVAIIRGFEPEICLKLAEAYVAGGIHAVEVTYVQTDRSLWKKTTDAIGAIAKNFGKDVSVGAGTVLTLEQLEMTRDAGGQFAVSPNEKPEIIRACVKNDMAAIPGALTPSEVVEAWEAGASFVKLFPAGCMGPKYVKAVKTPLAQIPLLAVGGITPDNIADFIKAGCVGAAVSGALANKEWMAAGEWGKITEVARAIVKGVRP